MPANPNTPPLPPRIVRHRAMDRLSQLRAEDAKLREALVAAERLVRELRAKLERSDGEKRELEEEVVGLDSLISTEDNAQAVLLQRLHLHFHENVSSSFNALIPPEILLSIFRTARAPRHQCDYSTTAGIETPWIRCLHTMLATTLVCKAWLGPSREVLYEEVVFRRMGQIPALARTLRSPVLGAIDADVGQLVRTIRIHSWIAFKPFAPVVQAELAYVLRQCTQLDTLSYHSEQRTDRVVYDMDHHGVRLGEKVSIIPSERIGEVDLGIIPRALVEGGLRTLDLMDLAFRTPELGSLHTLLSAGSRITVLRLWKLRKGDMGPEGLEGNIVLPRLEELVIPWENPGSDVEEYFKTRWRMPRLRRLTLVDCTRYPNSLLSRWGSQLRFLHFLSPYLDRSDRDLKLARECPALEHLVMPYWWGWGWISTDRRRIVSPTLKYLDLWIEPSRQLIKNHGGRDGAILWDASPDTGFAALHTLDRGACDTPRLAAVRFLIFGEDRSRISDLPLTCHPSLVSGHEMRTWRFPRMRVVQTVACVFSQWQEPRRGWVAFDPPGAHTGADEEFVVGTPPQGPEGDTRKDRWEDSEDVDLCYTSDDPDDMDYEQPESETESSLGSDDHSAWSEDWDYPFGELDVDRETMLEMYGMGVRDAERMRSLLDSSQNADSEDGM